MQLEREWGREPGWFYTLDRQVQIDLLGMLRVERTPEKQRRQNEQSNKAALIRQKIQEYQNRDQPQSLSR